MISIAQDNKKRLHLQTDLLETRNGEMDGGEYSMLGS